MTNNLIQPQFTPDCTRWETIFGWVYLPVHVILLPLLLPVLQYYLLPNLSKLGGNALYYGFSLAVVFVVFWKLLRREFDHFLDRPFQCLYAILLGYGIWYALIMVLGELMMSFGIQNTTPNEQAVDALVAESFNITMVISVIAAPILEEVLFRGIAFQSVRKRSRVAAYLTSMVLFSLYHVWQYAFLYQDVTYLLYAVLYLPITFAITWSYECSGSLWTAIFFHASNNYIAMSF